MPVFFKGSKRVLFIHVPKAGGTSIEAFFEANGFSTAYLDRGEDPGSLNAVRRCSPQHMDAALLRSLFFPAEFDYVFMTVRHPIRRLLSKFVMETASSQAAPSLEDWIFRVFPHVFADPGFMDNHLRPQSDFWLPEAAVFKLEDGFGEDFLARLEAGTGTIFTQRHVAHEMHAGLNMPDFSSLHPGAAEMIRTYYAQDFAKFGYQ